MVASIARQRLASSLLRRTNSYTALPSNVLQNLSRNIIVGTGLSSSSSSSRSFATATADMHNQRADRSQTNSTDKKDSGSDSGNNNNNSNTDNSSSNANQDGKEGGDNNDNNSKSSDDKSNKSSEHSYDTQSSEKRVGNPIAWANPLAGPTIEDNSNPKWAKVYPIGLALIVLGALWSRRKNLKREAEEVKEAEAAQAMANPFGGKNLRFSAPPSN